MWYANFLDYKPDEISLSVVFTLIGALLTRMAVFYQSQDPDVLNHTTRIAILRRSKRRYDFLILKHLMPAHYWLPLRLNDMNGC
jgi:hypothetical protein